MKPWIRPTAVLTILAMLSACTSYQFVSIDGSPQGAPVVLQQVVPGDQIRVTLNSGEIREFRVASVEADKIVGVGETHNLEDIQFLEVRRTDSDDNSLVIAVVVVIGLAIVLAISAVDDVFDCLGGACD